MSSCVEIYIKHNNDVFCIYSVSTSAEFGQILSSFTTYGEFARLTEDTISDCRNSVWRKIELYEGNVRKLRDRITQVGTWNNSVDEKIDYLGELDESVETTICDLYELQESIGILNFIDNMITIEDNEVYVGYEADPSNLIVKKED